MFPKKIDINQISTLHVLLKTCSVKETAILLGMSQSAVSRDLQELRIVFGDPLLLKTKGGMVLSKKSEQILYALPEWREATENIQNFSTFFTTNS